MKDGADADVIKSVLDVCACPVGHSGEAAQRAAALPAAPPQVRCREAAASEEGARHPVHPHPLHSLHQCPSQVFRSQDLGIRYIECALATPKATPQSSPHQKLDVLPACPSRLPRLQQDTCFCLMGIQTPCWHCSSSQAPTAE